MGASESTARPNRTTDDEGDGPPNNPPGGNSGGSGAAALAGAAAGIAVAAWGISKLMSNNDTETQETAHAHRLHNEPSSNFSPYNLLVSASGPNAANEQLPLSRWSPPPPGRFKMNTDGSCPNPVSSTYGGVNRGPSGIGGILRDHNGKWIRGFSLFIGVTDSLTSEFRAILKGLELLDKLKIKKAVLESDCEQAVNWVSRRDDSRGKREIIPECWNTIKTCRGLIDKNEIEVKHVQREGNRCADKLSRMAIETEDEQDVEIKDVPYELKSLVANDAKALRW